MKNHSLQAALLFISIAAIGLISCQAQERPNIVFIMADDLGYGDLSVYGSELIQTPNLDKLAARGIQFTDFHTNGMVCTPTRAAVLTGNYQQRTGLSEVVACRWHTNVGLEPEETTFADVLKLGGYHTALFGKWHLGVEEKYNPIHNGFNEFAGFTSGNVDYHSHINLNRDLDWWQQDKIKDEPGYQTEIIAQHAIRYIQNAKKDEPFCLYLPFGAPHTPNQRPYSKVERVPGHLSKKDQEAFRDSINQTIPKPPEGYKLAESKQDRFLDISIEMVTFLDDCVGKIVTELERKGLIDNTLIIFTSDNGPRKMLSSGPFKGGKGSLNEGGHRVPMIMSWPSVIEAGRVSDQLLMTMDLFPTLAQATGSALPKGLKLDGTSFLTLLKKEQEMPHRYCYWGKSSGRAMRDGQWKYIENEGGTGELYNLTQDLAEANNLAAQESKRVKKYSALINTWYEEVTKGVEQVINHKEITKRAEEARKKSK
ncbi:sulfatase [Carboxylicivirga sp. M1479]|uniref:sulfatase family protein n=1 Tax=Carboxylicivirga sp. M1479 TaxID=2594476 RepID=UPI0011788658|nr:sulfatase-like hydrolase/transferase [Carboxylicivirga sp. M1479]TRX66095.1 sulfatase-like hydrolase/transferase [Carboxylicivirga sp. M1479]